MISGERVESNYLHTLTPVRTMFVISGERVESYLPLQLVHRLVPLVISGERVESLANGTVSMTV